MAGALPFGENMNPGPVLKRDIRIAAVVAQCPVGRIRENLERVDHYAKKALAKNAKIVVFPEMNLTGYSVSGKAPPIALDSPHCKKVARIAKDHGVTLLCGMAEAGDNGHVYATHLAAFSDGNICAYRKIHINPAEKSVFSPGSEVPVFDADGFCFGIQLCYDGHFPELSTLMALAKAHVLFMPHASPRGSAQDKEQSWMRHLCARAFDNGVYVVAVNQSGENNDGLDFPGLAMVFDPLGRVTAKHSGGEGMLVADLSAEHFNKVRGHRMRYFLPHRQPAVYEKPVVRKPDRVF